MNQINVDSITSLSLSSIRPATATGNGLDSNISYPARIALGPTADVALLKVASQPSVPFPLSSLPVTVKELVLSAQVSALAAPSVPSAAVPSTLTPAMASSPTSASAITVAVSLQLNAGVAQLLVNSIAGAQLTASQQLGLLQQFAGTSNRRQPWDVAVRRPESMSGQPSGSSTHSAAQSVVLRLRATADQLTLSMLDEGRTKPLTSAMQRQWLAELVQQLHASPLKWQQLPAELKQLLQQQQPQLAHLPPHANIRLRLPDDASLVAVQLEQPETLPLTAQQQVQLGFKASGPQVQQGRVELSDTAKAAMANDLLQPQDSDMSESSQIATSRHQTAPALSAVPSVVISAKDSSTSTTKASIQPSSVLHTSDVQERIAPDLVANEAPPPRDKALPNGYKPVGSPATRPALLGADASDKPSLSPQSPRVSNVHDKPSPAPLTTIDLPALATQLLENTAPTSKTALSAAAQQVLQLVQTLPSHVLSEAQLQQELNAGLLFQPLQNQQTPASHAGGLAIALQLLLGRLGVVLPETKTTDKQQRLKEQISALDTQQTEAVLKQLSSQASIVQLAQLETVAMQKADTPSWMLCLPLPFAEQLQYGHCQIEQRQARRANGEPASLWHLTLSLEIPNHGTLLVEASLGPEQNRLQFYTPSAALIRTIERFGTILRDRLKLQGVAISSFDCTLGDIPDHLQHRGSSLLQVKV